MNHPPMCPKSPHVFDTACGLIGVWPCSWGHLHESNTVQRLFLARYQACAWQDRAERWNRITNRRPPYLDFFKDDCHWKTVECEHWIIDVADRGWEECRKNARAWREWEKSHD